MKHFWIILGVALLAAIPFALIVVSGNSTETYVAPTEQDSLRIHDTIGFEDSPVSAASDCGDTLMDPQTGQVSVGCDSGRSFVTDSFVTGVQEKAEALGMDEVNCARRLTTDANILRKNIEENSADITLEDMVVSCIKTSAGWEVSDIRCLQ